MSSPESTRLNGKIQHANKPQRTYAPEEADLNALITSASQSQLANLLRDLCSRSKTTAKLTRQHLLPLPLPLQADEAPKPKQVVPLRSILKKTSSFQHEQNRQSKPISPAKQLELLEPASTPTSSQMFESHGSSKRKPTTECRNCGDEYTDNSGTMEACIHHPGEREVHPEHKVWEDFDPDVLGDAWTLMEYEEFASGFRWSCCKRKVGGVGCVVGRHEAAPVGEWKRVRREG